MIRPLGQNRPPGGRPLRGRSGAGRAPGFHQRPAVGFLIVGNPHHEDFHFDAEQRPGEGQRGTPLPGAGFGGDAFDAGFLVVERLSDGGVGFVAAGRTDAFVLVIDPRRSAERPFQPAGPIQRAGSPLPIDLPDRFRNLDLSLGGHFLLDQRHREQRRQIIRPDRLQRTGMQHRRRWFWQVRDQVIPEFWHSTLIEHVFNGFAHFLYPTKQKPAGGIGGPG